MYWSIVGDNIEIGLAAKVRALTAVAAPSLPLMVPIRINSPTGQWLDGLGHLDRRLHGQQRKYASPHHSGMLDIMADKPVRVFTCADGSDVWVGWVGGDISACAAPGGCVLDYRATAHQQYALSHFLALSQPKAVVVCRPIRDTTNHLLNRSFGIVRSLADLELRLCGQTHSHSLLLSLGLR